MEMTGEYQNFEHREENEEDEYKDAYKDALEDKEYAETSFTDKEEENALFDKNKDLVKDPENFTNADKRIFLKKYFNYTVYGDAESRDFLYKLEVKKDPSSDSDVDVFFNGERIGEVDLERGKGTFNKSPAFYEFQRAYNKVKVYRTTTLKGQIEENTGDDSDLFNAFVEDGFRKKFARRINALENKEGELHESIELQQLREDWTRIENNKKVETDAGKQLLVDQIQLSRRMVDFQKKVLERIPVVGFLMVSAGGIIGAIVLLARALFYSGSTAVQPTPKKKTTAGKGKQGDFDPIHDLQKEAADLLETAGDNIEVVAGAAVLAYFVFKKQR